MARTPAGESDLARKIEAQGGQAGDKPQGLGPDMSLYMRKKDPEKIEAQGGKLLQPLSGKQLKIINNRKSTTYVKLFESGIVSC
ncbi:MAG: hypothetical protein AAF443_04100 [Chlamydiota bacterium]